MLLGGIKIFRIQILFIIIEELRELNSPRQFFSNYKNQLITDIINSVMVIIMFFLRVFYLIIFFMHGYDFITSISAAITSSVVGPGLGNIIGPENFSSLPADLKITLSIAMIIGRLEFIAFLFYFFQTGPRNKNV